MSVREKCSTSRAPSRLRFPPERRAETDVETVSQLARKHGSSRSTRFYYEVRTAASVAAPSAAATVLTTNRVGNASGRSGRSGTRGFRSNTSGSCSSPGRRIPSGFFRNGPRRSAGRSEN